MPIHHIKVSSKPDTGDPTLIQSTDWNAALTSPPWIALVIGGTSLSTWGSQPAALTEYLGIARAGRAQVDLTYADQMRVVVQVVTAGFTGAELRVQYWDGSAWQYPDGATGPAAVIDTTGDKASSWVTLVAGAKADRVLRVAGIGGNGVTSPVFGLLSVQVR